MGEKRRLLLLMLPPLLFFCFAAGSEAKGLSYDYTARIECVEKPEKAQYGGGLIRNPELEGGLEGWHAFGSAKIQARRSNGNNFIVAHHRTQPYDSISQNIYLKNGMLYTFSAWIRVSERKAPVTAVFKTVSGSIHAGAVAAESKCWSMLKGGLGPVGEASGGPAELYFESENTTVEIWVDSVSLQPFTQREWNSHHHQTIQGVRKRKVKIQAIDNEGKPIADAKISIQRKAGGGIPFGCATNKNILNNQAYQQWFTSRFKLTTFENEMKWDATEPSAGREDYSAADAMLQFMKQRGVAVRGHNIFWDDPQRQPSWLPSLPPSGVSYAVSKRVNSIVSRYKGQVIAWDVVNEDLHFNFFESKLGSDASPRLYKQTHDLDWSTPLFLNDFNTLEESGDPASTPAKYIEKLRQIQRFVPNPVAIGLESHFGIPNLAYMRASLDTLAATNLPIWLTEVDVKSSPDQAKYLEQVLREGHGHPGVKGIVVWAGWWPGGCYRMCLTDSNFKNLATGDVVDKLLHEWGAVASSEEAVTDGNGFFEASLYFGEYEVAVTHPNGSAANYSVSKKFEVLHPSNSSSHQSALPLLLQVSY